MGKRRAAAFGQIAIDLKVCSDSDEVGIIETGKKCTSSSLHITHVTVALLLHLKKGGLPITVNQDHL